MCIDVLPQIAGGTLAGAWGDRVEGTVDDRRLAYLGLASLIRNKRASGRTKDLLDIKLLREAGVDVDKGAGTPSSRTKSPGTSTPGS